MAATRDGINWKTSLGESYLINLRHRDGSRKKSQWCVDVEVEVVIFERSCPANLGDNVFRWGLYFGQSSEENYSFLSKVGMLGEHIAKFRVSGPPKVWHGYPAHPSTRIPQDRPPDSLLESWVATDRISKVHRRRLLKDQWM